MNIVRNIRIIDGDDRFVTNGLKRFIGREFNIAKLKQEENEYQRVFNYLINYILDANPVINDGQTIAYHSWMLKFVFSDNFITLNEISATGDSFIEGVDNAIRIVNEQREVCFSNSSDPLYPLFSQMIVVSKGVLEGDPIEAVRYKSPTHMTGWWITTDLYDGDIKSLQTMHYYHLAFKRPDILRYLALPYGYRFNLDNKVHIWFDPNAN